MKKHSLKNFYQIFLHLAVAIALLGINNTYGHGFGPDTLVRTQGGWQDIRLISTSPYTEHRWIYTYDPRATCVAGRVRAARAGTTNCYVRIGLDEKFKKDDMGNISCAPTQLFYVPDKNRWVPAYQLKVGDKLLSKCFYEKPITHIKFVKKPLDLYSIEVEEHHTYLVGRHCVLTHNMAFPAVRLLIEIPFEMAAAGGASGSMFGPPGITFGVVVGGIVGLSLMWKKPPQGEKDPRYKLDYELEGLLKQFAPAATKDGNPKEDETPKKPKNPIPDEKPKENEKKPKPKTPNQEAEEKARELGFKKAKPPFNTHGEPAFKKGETWITTDRDSHKGGFWKLFEKNGKRRAGTFDKDLKIKLGN
jgi:hypothetical protein